jgi:hypothetical protein
MFSPARKKTQAHPLVLAGHVRLMELPSIHDPRGLRNPAASPRRAMRIRLPFTVTTARESSSSGW